MNLSGILLYIFTPDNKTRSRVTLLAKQSHYSSALERSHVVLLEVQIPKAKPEGFQNSSMHITEISTGARLVMNYVGFKDSLIFSLIAWKCCKPYEMNAI